MSESLLCVSLGSLANILGWAVGVLIPGFFISGSITTGIPNLLLCEAIFATIPISIALFSLKDNPKFPPSFTALTKYITPLKLTDEYKQMAKNGKYIACVFCFGNMIGQGYSISSVISLFLLDLSTIT